jgi:hypothetical protein
MKRMKKKEDSPGIGMIDAKVYLDEIKIRKENKPNWGKKHLLGFDYEKDED